MKFIILILCLTIGKVSFSQVPTAPTDVDIQLQQDTLTNTVEVQLHITLSDTNATVLHVELGTSAQQSDLLNHSFNLNAFDIGTVQAFTRTGAQVQIVVGQFLPGAFYASASVSNSGGYTSESTTESATSPY